MIDILESDFDFKSVVEADKEFLFNLFSEPHTRQWWGDPDHEIALVFEGEASGESRGFIVYHCANAIGYVQCWQPCWSNEAVAEEPWQRDMGEGCLGIDIALSSRSLGNGAKIVASFARKLFDEVVKRLTIDPDVTNLRAIRAYKKAGFHVFDEGYKESHSVILMELIPDLQKGARDES